MHLANQKPEKLEHTIPTCSSLDRLSQHAVDQLKAREARHAIPAYTAQAKYPSIHCMKLTCIKEAAKAQNSRQADTAMCCTARRMRARGAAKLAAMTPWKTGQEL